MKLQEAKEFITRLLKTRLPGTLHYHDFDHTNSVLNAVTELAAEENIVDERELLLLKTAALFHDSGYLNTYEKHEEESCRIAREYLPEFGYTVGQIDTICSLIMKTKMPQQPDTILEKILCDADLDYLGRDDFEKTGKKLFLEWVAMGKIHDESEWNKNQIKFLESHSYWTKSAEMKRKHKKADHLRKLKNSQ